MKEIIGWWLDLIEINDMIDLCMVSCVLMPICLISPAFYTFAIKISPAFYAFTIKISPAFYKILFNMLDYQIFIYLQNAEICK